MTETNTRPGPAPARTGAPRAGSTAMALVIGLAALTATATETDFFRDVSRYCAVCWRNARLDPGLWEDCTQEVCCRLLTKARAGELDLGKVLDEDTPERRELVRAIDMVRKRVQRARRPQPLDECEVPGAIGDELAHRRRELGEILVAARDAPERGTRLLLVNFASAHATAFRLSSPATP